MRLVVIGNSAAGINAVERLRDLNPDAAIDVISEENTPIYSRCLLAYYLSGNISQADLLYRPDNHYREFNIRAHIGVRANAIDSEKRQVELSDGTSLSYDRLLLATGARSKLPDIPGVNLDGVYPFRDLADTMKIADIASSARKAVILGGGLIGLKAAQALKNLGLDVAIIVKSGRILSQMLDPEASEIFKTLMKKTYIDMISGREAVAFEGTGSVERVLLDDGSLIDSQLVIIGKGVTPNKELLETAGGETETGILVNEFLQSSLEGIYAAGDVIETRDLARGENRINAIWPCAVEQGRIAADNMSGKSHRYSGSMSMNTLEFFHLPVVSMGIVAANSPEYHEIKMYEPDRKIYKKVVLRDNVPVGMVFVNNIDTAGVVGTLIRRCVDVSSIRDSILDEEFSFAHIVPLVREQGDKFPESEFGLLSK